MVKTEKDPLRFYDTKLNLSEATASIGDLLFAGFNMGFMGIFILRKVMPFSIGRFLVHFSYI